jgi:hypothetical protein
MEADICRQTSRMLAYANEHYKWRHIHTCMMNADIHKHIIHT